MARQRTVQHRARRSGRHAREHADLKREQHRLADENARLRGDLEKARNTRPPRSSEAKATGLPNAGRSERADAAQRPLPTAAEGVQCSACGGSDVRRVDLGRVVLLVCAECKTKRRAE